MPVYLGILAILFYVSVIQIKNRLTDENRIRENLLKENATIIKNSIDQIYSDLCFLSELPEVTQFYSINSKGLTSDLEDILCAFIQNRKLYREIRLIDTLGWERLKINFQNEAVQVYRKEQFQNQSGSNYYKSIKALNSNEFFISPFDLNIEHGAIEIPFIPELKFGKTITNPTSGQKVFLVMNFLGDKMLDLMRKTSATDSVKCFLLNRQGYYLNGPSRHLEWRFHFPDSLEGQFMQTHPTEWKTLQSRKMSGHLKTKNGYFSFLKINICDYFLAEKEIAYKMFPQTCEEWILLTFDDRDQLYENVYYLVLRKYILYAIIVGSVLLAFTWIFSKIGFQQMKEKEQRALHYQFLNTLIETFPHPIFYIDYYNNELGCNEAFETMTGKSREELKNMRVEKLFDQSGFSKKNKKSGNDTVKTTEMRLKFPDDTIHSLLYYKASIMAQGERIGLVGVFTDISHIREVEIALRQSEQKLIQANRTKDRFFSLIAHDLKNPFHAIMGLSHLLKTSYTLITDEDRKNIADNIHNSAENTFQLLINLLEWARLQEGKIQLKSEVVELFSIAKDSVTLMMPKISEKKLTATLDIDYEIRVVADKNMVRTVFRNLISNAVKFTEEGGKIHIAARQVLKNIEISITDTGTGINNEEMKFLFKLDKKSRAQSNDGQHGTGLGLILCREFLEMNHGRIWAESIVGEGSIFYFTLPVPPAKA
jgi:PAS domain S-box-containing protein